MMNIRRFITGLSVILLFGMIGQYQAQPPGNDLPRCDERPGYRFDPRVEGVFWCLETVIDAGAEMAFTALTFAPDGTLYATRPHAGEVYALTDTDSDGLPDTPRLIVDGLTLPNALAWHDGALYIAGDVFIHRWADGELVTLVDDLATRAGLWTSGLTISPDERLVVGVGAPCTICEPTNPEEAAVVSFALDGSDRQILARGLRFPAGLTYRDDVLWVVDTASQGLAEGIGLDEINRVDVPGTHFGWPYCTATGGADLPATDFYCQLAQTPVYRLPTHSTPSDIVTYQGDAFPRLNGQLIVVLSGSTHRPDLHGFEIITIREYPDGTAAIETIAPVDNIVAPARPQRYDSERGYFSGAAQRLNQRYAGFFPHRLYKLAISPEGWIYFSWGGGRILVLRPGQYINVDDEAFWEQGYNVLTPDNIRPVEGD